MNQTHNRIPQVLIVDDEPFNHLLITEMLEDLDYCFTSTFSGQEAWDLLVTSPEKFDVVLLDRLMPDLDGLEVLRRIKQHDQLKMLPVILQTAASAPEQIAEGLEKGAFYYLTKPYETRVLHAVITTAVRDHFDRISQIEQTDQRNRALIHLDQAFFTFKTTESARQIAELLANACPAPQTAQIGLIELMLNAVEHGNLAISYAEKGQLLAENRLPEAIEQRLSLAEYRDRIASIRFRREEDQLIFTICDQGAGFDWTPYLEMSMARILDNHGRGIAMARSLVFSDLQYLGNGNCVEAKIRTT